MVGFGNGGICVSATSQNGLDGWVNVDFWRCFEIGSNLCVCYLIGGIRISLFFIYVGT